MYPLAAIFLLVTVNFGIRNMYRREKVIESIKVDSFLKWLETYLIKGAGGVGNSHLKWRTFELQQKSAFFLQHESRHIRRTDLSCL
jgi:hypothetical protein